MGLDEAESAGAATGLANTGGFTAAVSTQLAAAAILHLADVPVGVALLPMLGLLLVAVVQVVSRGDGVGRTREALSRVLPRAG